MVIVVESGINGIDVDLTTLSSTMVYSEVYNMMVPPDDYPEEGGKICVTGTFDTYQEGKYTYCTLRDARIGNCLVAESRTLLRGCGQQRKTRGRGINFRWRSP